MGDSMSGLLGATPFLIGGLLAVVTWGFEAYAFYFLMGKLNIPRSPFGPASIFAFSTFARVFSMLPGNGGFEVVMGLLLTIIGFSVVVATVPFVLFRDCTLWLFTALGLVFLPGWLTIPTSADLRR